jgi:hypothetical protein
LAFGPLIAALVFSVVAVHRERRQKDISGHSFEFNDPCVWNTWLLG